MYSKYVLSRDNHNYGIMGAPTGYLIKGANSCHEVCVGDVVHVPGGNANCCEHSNIVIMCDNVIGVMGSAGTPISESQPDKVEIIWQDIVAQGNFQKTYPNGAIDVKWTVKEIKA